MAAATAAAFSVFGPMQVDNRCLSDSVAAWLLTRLGNWAKPGMFMNKLLLACWWQLDMKSLSIALLFSPKLDSVWLRVGFLIGGRKFELLFASCVARLWVLMFLAWPFLRFLA